MAKISAMFFVRLTITSRPMCFGSFAQDDLAKIEEVYREELVVAEERSGIKIQSSSLQPRQPQPKISAIRNDKLRGVSLERLMQGSRYWVSMFGLSLARPRTDHGPYRGSSLSCPTMVGITIGLMRRR